jgi:RNA polymerase sigma-70 factor (ECF subfamily)
MSNPNTASRFDEIYNSTNKAVLAYITAKCRQTADICDVFQDTYMELYTVLEKCGADYVANDKAFVLKLAKRKLGRYYILLDRLRRFVSLTTTNEDGDDVERDDLSTDAFMVEDFTINGIILEQARQFIISKPEDVKRCFYLFYDVELTIPEIAKLLSMSESSVKNKLYRTIKEMQKLLQ